MTPYRVLLDTTVFCAAIRNPGGASFMLLRLGGAGLYQPVITQEIIAEWVRNCRAGLGKGRHKFVPSAEAIEALCAALEPMLSPEMVAAVRVGRAQGPLFPIRQEKGVVIVQIPHGAPQGPSRMLDTETLGLKDIGDMHLVEAALQYDCNFLCTANTRDFGDGLVIAGKVQAILPERLLRLLNA